MGFYGIENPNPTTPQYAYPRRGGAKLSGTCIVHTAEMYGALNTAAFCMRRSDYGCYHTIVDDNTILEVYPYEYETWQDSETNNWAVGISAACRASEWNMMTEAQLEGYYRNLAQAAADFVTYMSVMYGINVPRRRLTGAEARNRVPGFCAHGDSGIARSDPGAQFDWNRFFRYIEEALEDEEMTLSPSFEGNVRASLESLHTKEDQLITKYNKFDSQVREALDIIRNEQAAQRVLLTADRGLTKEELLDTIEKAVIKVNVSVGSNEPNTN